MPPRHDDDLTELVTSLCRLPAETEWVEFKQNLAKPGDVGEYISALANSAALANQATAYVIWGVQNGTHQIVGTSFDPFSTKVGNEDLEGWLNHLLTPRLHFRFRRGEVEECRVVVLEVPRAINQPVRFSGDPFIRIGSYRKKLKDQPEKERDLWRAFEQTPFELQLAATGVSTEDVLLLLDYPVYFDLLKQPLPDGRKRILEALASERLIQSRPDSRWDITNLGALLFAKKISAFPHLSRKALRVIQYKGTSRIETIKEQVGTKGYAGGFEGLIGYVSDLVPSNEVIGIALRRTVPMYPELAIRELVANAVIHQDLAIAGAGPMVEIFQDRLEITSPGVPLIDIARFLDIPPRSRNEQLAALMRRFGICEERGSGIDKVVSETELYQLPAPLFEVSGDNTRVVLYGHRPLSAMDREDRVRSCYLHACLKYVNREHMTNRSIRQRFGIALQNIAQASRLIKEAVTAGAIVPYDPKAAPKQMRYIPYWAQEEGT